MKPGIGQRERKRKFGAEELAIRRRNPDYRRFCARCRMPTHTPNPPMDSGTTSPRRLDPVLLVIVAIAAAGGALIVAKARNWAVMTDELLYTGMARSIASSIIPLPQVRGEHVPVNQVLYPTLIAPLVGALSMPVGYSWIAALNAVVVATAAIPAYLLTNFVTQSRAAARWVALCVVITPWLAFASKALPDSLAYVALIWSAYAMARTAGSSKHALKWDLLTLLTLALTYLVRNQFLFLAGVWVAVVVAVRISETLAEKSPKDLPRELLGLIKDRPIPIATFVIVIAIVKLQPTWLLGLYTITTTDARGGAAPTGVFRAIFTHASVIGLGVAGIPLVLGLPWLVSALTRVKERAENHTAIVLFLLSGAILYVGASFDVRFTESERVIERYVFYLAPLLFVAMAGLLVRPPKNIAAYALPALAGIYLLKVSDPYGLDNRLTLEINHVFSPMQIAFVAYQRIGDSIGFSIFMLAATIAFVTAVIVWWLLTSGLEKLALNSAFAVTALIILSTTLYTVPKIVKVQNELIDNIYGDRTDAQKAWIDEATGGTRASLVFTPRADPTDPSKVRDAERVSNWWDLAFWNGDISSVYVPYRVDPQLKSPYPGKAYTMLPDWETGELKRNEGDDASYLVQAESDGNFGPQYRGAPKAQSGYVIYETGRSATAAWATKGLTVRGWVPPSGATLRVWAPQGAKSDSTLTVRLKIATTAGPNDFSVEGADSVRATPAGTVTTYSWKTTIALGDHADFKLVRGRGNAHVESIRVSSLPGQPRTDR